MLEVRNGDLALYNPVYIQSKTWDCKGEREGRQRRKTGIEWAIHCAPCLLCSLRVMPTKDSALTLPLGCASRVITHHFMQGCKAIILLAGTSGKSSSFIFFDKEPVQQKMCFPLGFTPIVFLTYPSLDGCWCKTSASRATATHSIKHVFQSIRAYFFIPCLVQ